MLPKRKRCAIILGGADCVWRDVLFWETEYGKLWDGMVIAVNDIGCHWPRTLDAWATLHPNKLRKWEELRRVLCMPASDYETWGKDPVDPAHRAEFTYEPHWLGGSSGLYAVELALGPLQCNRAILCGMPLTPTGHFQESQEEFTAKWGSAEHHWKHWKDYEHLMHGRVKSMSGNTRGMFGAPTLDWLYG